MREVSNVRLNNNSDIGTVWECDFNNSSDFNCNETYPNLLTFVNISDLYNVHTWRHGSGLDSLWLGGPSLDSSGSSGGEI